MANEIFTRLQLKHDSYANWDAVKSTFKPLPGEICIVEVPTGNAAATTAPTVLFKVGAYKKDASGNNTTELHTFAELPWASALAADVYAWAKKTEEEFITWVNNQIEHPTLSVVDPDAATKKFITKIEVDDHKITVTRSDVDWNDVKNAPDFALKSEIPTELGVMSVKATGDDEITMAPTTAENGDVTITAAHATHTAGSAKTASTGEISGYGDTGTIKIPKIVTNAAGHVTEITEETVTITMPAEQNLEHDHDGKYKQVQTAISETFTGAEVLATVSQNANGDVTVTKRTITAADLGLASAMHFIGAYTEAPKKAFVGTSNERELADGDVYLNTANNTEYVYSNKAWVELGNEGSHALNSITITGNDGLEGGGDLTANRTIGIKASGVTTAKIADKNVTKDKLADDVQASLAKADSALQEQDISSKADKVVDATKGNFAGLDENGNLTDSGKKASDFATAAQGALADTAIQPEDIETIATSGSIYDIKEGSVEGTSEADKAIGLKYLVFNCGTAFTVI